MDPPKLDTLPSVVVHLICGFLWETSRESLRALSTVNSSCYHATVPFLYRNLTIKASTREKLRRDIAKLTENELSQKVLKYVRRLEVKGKMPLLERETGEEQIEGDYNYRQLDEISDHDVLEPRFNQVFIADQPEDPADESSRAWSPLVSFISSLRSLTDLVYACDNQVPPCMLQALHQHHPACRLDIRTFRFRSLRDPITDPNELALVTSPCLHSLSVKCVWRDSNGNDDYNEEAVLRAVAIAPNLKHLNMLGCRPASSPELARFIGRARIPWKGFIPPVDTFQIGSLESLSFCGYQNITRKKLEKWGQHTDLSKLQSLVLRNVSYSGALMDAALGTRFKSMQRLAIYLERKDNDDNFAPSVETFFDSMNPLTALRLKGSLDASLVAKILSRHGNTLRELVLKPYETEPYSNPRPAMILTKADILSIRDRCPLLQTLNLKIKRSKSDTRETHCYVALSTFPSLTKLSIHLDCSNLPAPDPPHADEDEFHRELNSRGMIHPLYNAHIRDALVNSAIDETLARSIWNIIATDKPGQPLTYLRITSGVGSAFGRCCLGDLMSRVVNMSRSFLLTRMGSEHDDSKRDGVEVVEVGRRAREERDEWARKHEAEMERRAREDRDERAREHEAEMVRRWGYRDDDKMGRIFERLWPPKLKDGRRDWRDDWSSWPLQKI